MEWQLSALSRDEAQHRDRIIEQLAVQYRRYHPKGVPNVGPVFTGTEKDLLDRIGYIYYEGFHAMFDQRLLEEGQCFLLGYTLVNKYEFQWVSASRGETRQISVYHEEIDELLRLSPETLRRSYPAEWLDGEEPYFDAYVMEALDAINQKLSNAGLR